MANKPEVNQTQSASKAGEIQYLRRDDVALAAHYPDFAEALVLLDSAIFAPPRTNGTDISFIPWHPSRSIA